MDSLRELARHTPAGADEPLPELEPGEISGVFLGFNTLPGNVENLNGFEDESVNVLGPYSWVDDEYPLYKRLCVALDREAILTLKAWHVLG